MWKKKGNAWFKSWKIILDQIFMYDNDQMMCWYKNKNKRINLIIEKIYHLIDKEKTWIQSMYNDFIQIYYTFRIKIIFFTTIIKDYLWQMMFSYKNNLNDNSIKKKEKLLLFHSYIHSKLSK
jgi:hypothetical protein